MNFLKQAHELLPLVMAWNHDMKAFLAKEHAPQALAVTY